LSRLACSPHLSTSDCGSASPPHSMVLTELASLASSKPSMLGGPTNVGYLVALGNRAGVVQQVELLCKHKRAATQKGPKCVTHRVVESVGR